MQLLGKHLDEGKRTNRVKAADVKQGGYAAPPTGAQRERDGWMDGWMACGHETLFYFLKNFFNLFFLFSFFSISEFFLKKTLNVLLLF
jgi:hypothetical protein